jgi:hypothetical protein
VGSEKFPHTPFDPVPGNRSPHPFGDGDAQPAAVLTSGSADGYKIAVLNSFPDFRQCQKFRSSEDPFRFFKLMPGQTLHLAPKGLSPSPQNGSTNGANGPYWANRLRPLARRRLIILWPAFVDIRFRNPWVLALFNLLG